MINSEAYLITSSFNKEKEGPIYLGALNSTFLLSPNWESSGVCVSASYRPDRGVIQVFLPAEILYNQKQKMKPHIKSSLAETFPKSVIEWVELPDLRKFDSLQSYKTFSRMKDGFWIEKKVPVGRSMFASRRIKADPGSRGKPGGPCQVIDEITTAPIDPFTKEDLVKDVERGKDLDNLDLSKVYEKEVVSFGGDLFHSIGLTYHGQYRMDLRSLPLASVKKAFHEFERWFNWRKKNQDKMTRDERLLLKDLASGKTTKFEASREGVTLIFTMPKPGKARLVSTWWTGKPDPSPPKPGECKNTPEPKRGFIMNDQLEKIATELMLVSSELEEKTACGDTPCESCSNKAPTSWYQPEESSMGREKAPMNADKKVSLENLLSGPKNTDWIEDHSLHINTGGGDLYFVSGDGNYWGESSSEEETEVEVSHWHEDDNEKDPLGSKTLWPSDRTF